MMNNKVYKFYSNCLIVKGAHRSTICDLQRNKYHFIPNSILSILNGDLIYYDRIIDQLDSKDKLVFQEYIDYLLEFELIFELEERLIQYFPKLGMEWDFPSYVSNAIFDGDCSLQYFNQSLLVQLEVICCNYFQIRFYDIVPKPEIERIIKLIMPSQIKAFDLTLAEDVNDEEFYKWIISLVNKNKKIRNLTIHSTNKNEKLQGENYGFGTIIKVKEKVKDNTHCGNIHHSYFSINIETFTESQHHNTCLNRKISIDIEGNIKNCPSMTKSYGNIKDTRLIDVVNSSDFQKVWQIKKDEVTKCKDCEFRHVCTDCRAFIDNPKDIYSAPLKCGYNPYTCEWDEWSSNVLKKNALEHYSQQLNIKK